MQGGSHEDRSWLRRRLVRPRRILLLLATAHAYDFFIDYCNGNPVGWGSAGASANAQYSSIGQA